MIGRFCCSLVLSLSIGTNLGAAELPLFDSHIHYNHDVWVSLPARDAVERLRAAGIQKALVSSSSDEGTQRLYTAAPDVIIPELRPYRQNGETSTWVRDESVIEYLQERLARYRYVAIGEFHVNGADADLPVVRRVVLLAKQQGLMLHAHSDADAIERLFRQDPDAHILWAHAGYEPPSVVEAMLARYDHLWVELSSRDDLTVERRLSEVWRALLVEFPARFLVGTDTHAAHRWDSLTRDATTARTWLAELPPEIAERIAYKNGDALLGARYSAPR